MKMILSLILCVAVFNAAQCQGKAPAPSPGQTVKQDFASSSVELSYSRPGVKGRNIFGDVVPYGKVWRTGANAGTTLTFGESVMIGGKKIPAGKYGLLTIPNQSEWTVIITKQTNVTHPEEYKQAEDVVRLSVKPAKMSFSLETMLITFDNIKDASMDIEIIWGNTAVSFPVTTAK